MHHQAARVHEAVLDYRLGQQVVMQDQAFARDLCRSAFAAALYNVLENGEFVGPSEMVRVKFGQRSAARFVAALRGNGEIYLDYAWDAGPPLGPMMSSAYARTLSVWAFEQRHRVKAAANFNEQRPAGGLELGQNRRAAGLRVADGAL